jgi:hypothetical protein
MCFPKLRLALRLLIVFGLLALLLPLEVGCGGGKGAVSGSVTLDGQPLPIGNISFLPSKGPGATARIEDGKYSVKGVPSGEMKVTVETESIKQEMEALATAAKSAGGMDKSAGGRMSPQMMAKMPENAKKQYEEQKQQAGESAGKLKELQAKYREVPAKYSDPKSSGLSTTVKSGQNSFDVQLSSK